MGVGQTHHYAFAVPDDETQQAFREKLISQGYRVSPVMDRIYFKSIYTSDPDGHIVELATAGPGFLVDEDRESLGQAAALAGDSPLRNRSRAVAGQLTGLVANGGRWANRG